MKILSSNNGYLGVDIGTSGIKIVELEKEGGEFKIATYGFSEYADIAEKGNWQDDLGGTARNINKILSEAGAKSKSVISALPTFSVFSSVLNLSNVSQKEIESAVHWEAKKVIPLPLEEMNLDWKIIEDEEGKKKGNIKALLMGAPKSLVDKYMNIFREAQLNLLSLETETFSLTRSLVGNDKSTVMIVEFGAATTDISIVKKGIPLFNRSLDIGGATITKTLSNNLSIGMQKAEQFKCDLGVASLGSGQSVVPKIIFDTIAPIVNEMKYAFNLFQQKNGEKAEKIILSGGSALIPGLEEHLSKVLDIKVIIGDPWSRISYPVDLKPVLNEIGPKMSVAVGLAMRELE